MCTHKSRVLTGTTKPTPFSFLLSNENEFEILDLPIADRLSLVNALAEKYDVEPSLQIVNSFLERKIEELLTGDGLELFEFVKFEQFIAKNFYAGNENFAIPFCFLGNLRSHFNQFARYSVTPSDWMQAKDCLQDLISLSGTSIYDFENLYKASKVVGIAAKQLTESGFDVTIGIGAIEMSEAENDRVIERIKALLQPLGFWAAKLALVEIQKLFDKDSDRFYLSYARSWNTPIEAQIPWGYILNTSLQYYRPKQAPRNVVVKFKDAVFFITTYLSLYELQDFSMVRTYHHVSILNAIRNHIMYDNLYCFPQHNPKHIFQLTVGVFRTFLPDFPSLKIYLDIYSAAFGTYKIGKELRLSLKFFLDMLSRSHPRAAIKAALQQLSFGNVEINSGYCYPEDMEKLSFYKKPFIFDGNNFVCLNLNFFGAGFYSSIYDVSEKQGITSSDIGDSAEEYLAELFQIHGVSLFPEKKYKISGAVRKKLAINRREGECDFIIETENTIVFLELKKKPLTAQARAGDIVQATLDLSTSLFHGLAQTGWHELILRSEKEIVFENGARLSLNNRKIERVAVSLSEFFSIDDSNFVHELLRNLIGARISSIEEEIPSKIHKYLDELNFQYETEFFKSEYNDLKNRFWNCSFFSIEQLMVILNHSTGNSSFCDELFAARTFTVNSSDWYRDYFHKKSLLPHHDAVTSV